MCNNAGGGVRCRVHVTTSTFTNCSTWTYGGALLVERVGDISLNATNFAKCSAGNVRVARDSSDGPTQSEKSSDAQTHYRALPLPRDSSEAPCMPTMSAAFLLRDRHSLTVRLR